MLFVYYWIGYYQKMYHSRVVLTGVRTVGLHPPGEEVPGLGLALGAAHAARPADRPEHKYNNIYIHVLSKA